MGTKFEVWVWVSTPRGFEYKMAWRGGHLVPALWAAFRAKRRFGTEEENR